MNKKAGSFVAYIDAKYLKLVMNISHFLHGANRKYRSALHLQKLALAGLRNGGSLSISMKVFECSESEWAGGRGLEAKVEHELTRVEDLLDSQDAYLNQHKTDKYRPCGDESEAIRLALDRVLNLQPGLRGKGLRDAVWEELPPEYEYLDNDKIQRVIRNELKKRQKVPSVG